jgi:hypothetical protein
MPVRVFNDIFGNFLSPCSGIFETAWRRKSGFTCKGNFMRMSTRFAFKENVSFI